MKVEFELYEADEVEMFSRWYKEFQAMREHKFAQKRMEGMPIGTARGALSGPVVLDFGRNKPEDE